MASGKVKWWDNRKGYGFIAEDTGHEFFVHYTGIVGPGYKTLKQGEEVLFDVVPCEKGFKAENVHRHRNR